MDPAPSDTPRSSHRSHRRALIADACGPGYAAVIERAAELHYRLAYAADGDTDEAVLVSVAYNQARYETALTLAALREAATLILSAPPLNKKTPTANQLPSLHIWRMARAIERDERDERDQPDTTDQHT